MPELVIFDFDGTMFDTADDIVITTNRLLQELGKDPLPKSIIVQEIGEGLKVLIQDLFPEVECSDQKKRLFYNRFLELYEDVFLNQPQIYPGLREFLNSYKGKVAIASNKTQRYIPPVLEKFHLLHYDWVDIIGGDSFDVAKPHAKPLLHIMEKAGVDRSKTVMIGDGLPDVGAANAAGVKCIAVDFGYARSDKLMQAGASHLIKHYDELLPLLSTI